MSVYACVATNQLTDTILDVKDACICIQRRASDDVSSAFLAKALQIIEGGEQARIICVDEISMQRYLEKLPLYPALDSSHISTLQDLCLEIISDNSVSEAIGRSPRVLDENEQDFLFEDMKVSGLKQGRLREILKFFFKSMSDCENEKKGWLITGEEQQLFAILEANLEFRQAMLKCELPGQAYQGLRSVGEKLAPLTILCDDFGTLSKASQRLIEYLATSGLIIAGTMEPAKNAMEDYPNQEGFMGFPHSYPQAQLVKVKHDKADVRISSKICFDPNEEFSFIAHEVLARINDGVRPYEILVAVPNSTWKRNISCALDAQGIPVSQDVAPEKIPGNPRLPEKSALLKLATFLKLHRDPKDVVALRSWLGLGDWLLRSNAFLELMAYAQDNNMDAIEAVTALRAEVNLERNTLLFMKFDKALHELDELKNRLVDPISQTEVIELLSEHGMPIHEKMHDYLGDNPDQADLLKLEKQIFQPQVDRASTQGVSIAQYRRCHGRHVRTLFISGLINGFLPEPDAVDDRHTIDHQVKAIERDRELFNDLEATASDEIICTSFEQDLLANTASLNMQVSRVFIKDGERFARVELSEFYKQSK